MLTPRRAQGWPWYWAGTSSAPRGRSRIWPTEESTTYSSPRYPAMLLTLFGDSTITSFDTWRTVAPDPAARRTSNCTPDFRLPAFKASAARVDGIFDDFLQGLRRLRAGD